MKHQDAEHNIVLVGASYLAMCYASENNNNHCSQLFVCCYYWLSIKCNPLLDCKVFQYSTLILYMLYV